MVGVTLTLFAKLALNLTRFSAEVGNTLSDNLG